MNSGCPASISAPTVQANIVEACRWISQGIVEMATMTLQNVLAGVVACRTTPMFAAKHREALCFIEFWPSSERLWATSVRSDSSTNCVVSG